MCSVLFRDGFSGDSSMFRDDLLEQIWEGGGSDASEGGTKMGRWLTRRTYQDGERGFTVIWDLS